VKNNGEIGIHTKSIRLIISNTQDIFILISRLLIFSKSHVCTFIKIFHTDINDAVLRKLCQIICINQSLSHIGHNHNENRIIHIFSLLEYANALFKCFCLINVNPAVKTVRSHIKINKKLVKTQFQSIKSTIFLILYKYSIAKGSKILDIVALIGVGQDQCASGSHVFTGKSHILVHIQIRVNIKPTFTNDRLISVDNLMEL